MTELRMHGRGGQGAVLAAEILATALVLEGKYAASFPFFGSERRGAPVQAFVRFGTVPIRERTRIYHPDLVLVTDRVLAGNPLCYNGIKVGGIVIANANPEKIIPVLQENIEKLAAVDANSICQEEIGRVITNTCMLGALAGATQAVKLESVEEALKQFFKGKVLTGNIRCLHRGYNEVSLKSMEAISWR
jgi:2-oxoacid:acceptor oxidoreductase gamma subunit (pyruvate/2-ketoisovalerate family)